jgi:pre-mRNA-splicing factor ATP-dependent RNA helicase DHX15/PRP43
MSVWGGKETSDINPFTGKKYSKFALEQQEKMRNLPSGDPKIKEELFSLLDSCDVIIAEAETGAGKSTNIPQYLLLEYLIQVKKMKIMRGIMVTQPRTTNAENIATYVAKIVDVKLGDEVGYKFRHDNKTSDKTLITYATDGTLVQELYNSDGNFDYDIVIVDEVHERSLGIDIILAFIRNYIIHSTVKKRCKFIITSATLDCPLLTKYFADAPSKVGHLKIPGRAYPVSTHYLNESIKHEKFYDKYVIDRIGKILSESDKGDILIFAEAKSSINRLCNKIDKEFKEQYKIVCLPLYRGVSSEEQQLAISPDLYKKLPGKPKRKIVISTNIAESGVTVEGVLYVIDTGFRYLVSFENRINVFNKVFITKDSAEQRKGRAGRTAPGTCYRLFTEEEFDKFPEHKEPEILVSNIDSVIINLLATKFIKTIKDLSCFLGAMITPPKINQVKNSLKYLYELQMLKSECNNMQQIITGCKIQRSKAKSGCFTSIAKCANKLPLDIPLAIVLLASHNYSVTKEIMVLVSMLMVDSNPIKWFNEPSRFDKKEYLKFEKVKKKYMNTTSDLIGMLSMYATYRKHKKSSSGNKLNKWAKKNYFNLFYFLTTDKNIKQLKGIYNDLKKSCYIKNVAKPSKNTTKNQNIHA